MKTQNSKIVVCMEKIRLSTLALFFGVAVVSFRGSYDSERHDPRNHTKLHEKNTNSRWKYFLQKLWVMEHFESGLCEFGQFFKELFIGCLEVETRFSLHALFQFRGNSIE